MTLSWLLLCFPMSRKVFCFLYLRYLLPALCDDLRYATCDKIHPFFGPGLRSAEERAFIIYDGCIGLAFGTATWRLENPTGFTSMHASRSPFAPEISPHSINQPGFTCPIPDEKSIFLAAWNPSRSLTSLLSNSRLRQPRHTSECREQMRDFTALCWFCWVLAR